MAISDGDDGGKMAFEFFPFTMGWEITLACNLRCKHCGSSAGQPRKNELTTDEALRICDQMPSLLIQEVDFTGGEPLLRPDLYQIALRLKELKITTGIVTNGVALDQKNIPKLKESGISHVAVSVDGIGSTHDFIRGQDGLYDRILGNIGALLKEEMPATVITTVTKLNIDELPVLYETLLDIGIARWRPQPLIVSGRAEASSELLIDEETFLKLADFYQEWANRDGMEILRADGLGYFLKSDPSPRHWYGCPAGLVAMGITSDGKVKGCLSLPDEFTEGDLRQNDLWDIWFDEASFPYARNFSKEKLGDNCNSCEKWEQCKGGCTAMSYGCTGKTHNDPLCYLSIMKQKQPTH